MNRVRDKVALVTGAGSAVGRACALRLAAEGAAVFATDSAEAAARATAEQIGKSNGRAQHAAQQVADATGWTATLDAVKRAYGRLDIVVNAAQVYLKKSIRDTTLADVRAIEDTNFVGCWLAAKHALPMMREGGARGSFVFVSSVLGQVGLADAAAYGAIAGAIRIFIQSVALECGAKNDGIRANAVLAGPEPLHGLSSPAGPLALPQALQGSAETIAETVVYLASDESRFVTASAIVIDDGYSAA